MGYKQNNTRFRQFVHNLNKARKLQAKKIDILCNDILGAHKKFINSLDKISFTADFYEAIIGQANLEQLLQKSCELIHNQIDNCGIAILLIEQDRLEDFIFEHDKSKSIDPKHIRESFDRETVINIAKSNKVCTTEDMCKAGLQINPVKFGSLDTFGIPLESEGLPIGMILLYRQKMHGKNWTGAEKVTTITSGFSKAVKACRKTPQLATVNKEYLND